MSSAVAMSGWLGALSVGSYLISISSRAVGRRRHKDTRRRTCPAVIEKSPRLKGDETPATSRHRQQSTWREHWTQFGSVSRHWRTKLLTVRIIAGQAPLQFAGSA